MPDLKFQKLCDCGWELPLSVMPRLVEDVAIDRVTEDTILPGAGVTLLCPRCTRLHGFLTRAPRRG